MSSSLNHLAQRWGPALIMMILIFVASATPGQDFPDFGRFDFDIKKAGHMTGYALLGIAYLYGLSRRKSATRGQLLLAMSLAFLYAVSDEFHQSFTPGRTPSIYDVGIDTAGAILGVAFWSAIQRRLTA